MQTGTTKTGGTPQNLALSIDNGMKLMIMGTSQDYTTCKGVTRGGKKCSNFASLSDGGYCDYHVRKAYDASRSRRMECQNGLVQFSDTLDGHAIHTLSLCVGMDQLPIKAP